jgi:hypothetical protein
VLADSIKYLAFDSGGKYLTTFTERWDGEESIQSVQPWLWRPKVMIDRACSLLINSLTPEESSTGDILGLQVGK